MNNSSLRCAQFWQPKKEEMNRRIRVRNAAEPKLAGQPATQTELSAFFSLQKVSLVAN